MNTKKRGLSPVIATVLLIAIVVIIALVIFLFFQSTIKVSVIKFGQNIEIICDQTDFQASYSGGTIQISNGNTPIQNMKAKLIGNGKQDTKDIVPTDGWPSNGLGEGATTEITAIRGDPLSTALTDVEEIVLIPVLLGTNENTGADEKFTCDENDGFAISLE